jgi:hypothetical protein
MGSNLKPPDQFNERGYFEDVAVTDLTLSGSRKEA